MKVESYDMYYSLCLLEALKVIITLNFQLSILNLFILMYRQFAVECSECVER